MHDSPSERVKKRSNSVASLLAMIGILLSQLSRITVGAPDRHQRVLHVMALMDAASEVHRLLAVPARSWETYVDGDV